MTTLDLCTLKNTINNVKVDTKEIEQNISIFLADPETESTAREYMNMMEEISEKLQNSDVEENEKQIFRSLFITMFGTFCEKDCFSTLLSKSYQRNKKYSTMIKNLEELYQKERDSYNDIARKHKEQEKEKKVELPGFQLSITTHKNKRLSVKDCLALNNEIKLAILKKAATLKTADLKKNRKKDGAYPAKEGAK